MKALLVRFRPWLSFSLRTMFVLIALLAVWLGWTRHVVHERLAARQSIVDRGGRVWVRHGIEVRPIDNGRSRLLPMLFDIEGDTPTVPVVRRWLGDEPVEHVEIDSAVETELTVERLRELFPEALTVTASNSQHDYSVSWPSDESTHSDHSFFRTR